MSLTPKVTVRAPSSSGITAILEQGSASLPSIATAAQSGLYRLAGSDGVGVSVNGTARVEVSQGNVSVVGNTRVTTTSMAQYGGGRRVDGLPRIQPTWQNLGSYADPSGLKVSLTLANVTTYGTSVKSAGTVRQTTLANRPTYVPADATDGRPAIAFDRTSTQYLTGDSMTFNCGTNGGLTAVVMVKLSGTPSSYENVFFGINSESGYYILCERNNARNQLGFYVRNATTLVASGFTSTTLSQERWYVLAFRVRSVAGTWTAQCYENGVLTDSMTPTAAIADRTWTWFSVGAQPWGPLNGAMRYLGLWDRPLTDAELTRVTEAARIYPDLQGVPPILRYLQGSRDSCLVESSSDMIVPGPTGFGGGLHIAGAVVLPDGRIFCPPNAYQNIARLVDPRTNVVTSAALPYAANGDSPYQGSVLLPNGKVFLLPRYATYGLTFDPATDTATTNNVTFSGTPTHQGGVLLPSGQVFLAPYNATYALLYDYVSDSLSTPTPVFPGSAAFNGATLMADGRVFCVPWNGTTARIFNPITSEISTPSGTYPGSQGAFGGAVLLPDGRIFIVPYNSTTARIYDAQSDILSTPNGTYPGNAAYRSAVLTACGRVALIPNNAANAVIWDPQSDTLSTARGTVASPDRSYWGGVLLPDGRIFMTPCNKTQALYLVTGGTGFASLPNNVLLSPWLNNKH